MADTRVVPVSAVKYGLKAETSFVSTSSVLASMSKTL